MKPWWAFVLTGVGFGMGCASGALSDYSPDSGAPAWPPDDPKVRFEKSVETKKDIGKQSFLNRLAGQGPESLFVRPFGVAWAGDDLLVTDPGAGLVLKLTNEGKVIRSTPGLLVGPIGVAVCEIGIIVTDSRGGRVGLFDERLHLVRWVAEGLERPTGVACLPGGVAIVETAAHRVRIFYNGGETTLLGSRGPGAGEFNFPTAMKAEDSTLWIGDTLNFRIVGMDAVTGRTIRTFGHLGDSPGETPRTKGLALDSNGHLWASDAHLDVVAIFDRNGVFLMDIGGHGRGEGEFNFPAGIAAHPDGRVAVVDSLNQRIQILRILDSPIRTDVEGR